MNHGHQHRGIIGKKGNNTVIFKFQHIYVVYMFIWNIKKLDGVGPVDNRLSTDQLQHYVKFMLRIRNTIFFYKLNIYFFDM